MRRPHASRRGAHEARQSNPMSGNARCNRERSTCALVVSQQAQQSAGSDRPPEHSNYGRTRFQAQGDSRFRMPAEGHFLIWFATRFRGARLSFPKPETTLLASYDKVRRRCPAPGPSLSRSARTGRRSRSASSRRNGGLRITSPQPLRTSGRLGRRMRSRTSRIGP